MFLSYQGSANAGFWSETVANAKEILSRKPVQPSTGLVPDTDQPSTGPVTDMNQRSTNGPSNVEHVEDVDLPVPTDVIDVIH